MGSTDNFVSSQFYPDNPLGYAENLLSQITPNLDTEQQKDEIIFFHLFNNVLLLSNLYLCICYAFFVETDKNEYSYILTTIINSLDIESCKTKLQYLKNKLKTNINNLIQTRKKNITLINNELSCDKVIQIRNSSFTELQSIVTYEELDSYIKYNFDLQLNVIDDNTDIQELLDNFKYIFLLEHDKYFDPSWIFFRSNWFISTYGSHLLYNDFIKLSKNTFPLENIEENGIIRYNECVKIIESEMVSPIHNKKKIRKSKEGNLAVYKRIQVLHDKFDSAVNELQGALQRYNSQFQSEDKFDYSICEKLTNKDGTEYMDVKDLTKQRICNAIKEVKSFLEKQYITDIQLTKVNSLYNQTYGHLLKSSGLKEMIKDLNRKGGSLEYSRLNWLFHLQGIFVVVASAFYSTLTFE
jgi:hypothetical protein